jgi:hypothetical protein
MVKLLTALLFGLASFAVTAAPASADPYPDELPDPICVGAGVPTPLGWVIVTYCEPWD